MLSECFTNALRTLYEHFTNTLSVTKKILMLKFLLEKQGEHMEQFISAFEPVSFRLTINGTILCIFFIEYDYGLIFLN